MKIRHAGSNKWELFQTVPHASGYSNAPAVDEVVLTLTDADLASTLHALDAIDHADESVTRVMLASTTKGPALPLSDIQQKIATSIIPVVEDPHDRTLHDLATGAGMPDPPAHLAGS